MEARIAGRCACCGRAFPVGAQITKASTGRWVLASCAARERFADDGDETSAAADVLVRARARRVSYAPSMAGPLPFIEED